MATLLFEVGTEELPSWYVTQGREALADLLVERLAGARLAHGAVASFATPRRLAVRVVGVAEASERRVERRRGPAASVAFGEDGVPTKAGEGFARGQGVAPEALQVEETEKGAYVFAEVETGGVPVHEVLPALLEGVVRDLPAPRKMRWGDVQDVTFVRPIAWLLARLGEEILPVSVAGLEAGGVSRGHRFHAPGGVEVTGADGYVDALRDARVLVDPVERREATVRAIEAVAAAEGLTPVWDGALLDEVIDLVEWPVAILGRFDARYLALPDEVLATVMIHHQRFVPLRSEDGAIADRFVGISNTEVTDPAVVRAGYEAVLDGRLYDARFFWDADKGKTLAQHAWALDGIGFQKELGSMADKVTRLGEVAGGVADALGLPADAREALDAALPLFRADLATDMVYELPELEGVMARAYAREEGQPEAVAQALLDGVRPVAPGAELPEGAAGAVIAAVDRADTLLGFFALGKRPTGSADPFGLRRAAGALARIAVSQAWHLPLRDLLELVAAGYDEGPVTIDGGVLAEVEGFIWDRAASLLAEEGVGVTQVRAAVAGHPSVVLAARRAHLLQALAGSEPFAQLQELYKRAANLAENASEGVAVDPERFEAPEAEALHARLADARAGVDALMAGLAEQLPAWALGSGPVAVPDPSGALPSVLALKDPLDRFLDDVLVMVDDLAVRANRLALLREVRDVLRGLGALEELAGSSS